MHPSQRTSFKWCRFVMGTQYAPISKNVIQMVSFRYGYAICTRLKERHSNGVLSLWVRNMHPSQRTSFNWCRLVVGTQYAPVSKNVIQMVSFSYGYAICTRLKQCHSIGVVQLWVHNMHPSQTASFDWCRLVMGTHYEPVSKSVIQLVSFSYGYTICTRFKQCHSIGVV